MFLESGIENSSQITGKENLESFLENSPVGIHIVNEEGIILFANKAELELLVMKGKSTSVSQLRNFITTPKKVKIFF